MAGARGTDECRVVVGVCVCPQVAKHSVRPYPESRGDRGGGRLKDGAEISLCVSEAAKSPCSSRALLGPLGPQDLWWLGFPRCGECVAVEPTSGS